MVIVDKLILFFFCIIISEKGYGQDKTVLAALMFFSLTSFYTVIEEKRVKRVLILIYILTFVFFPQSIMFLPLFLYDWLEDKNIWMLGLAFLTFLCHGDRFYFNLEWILLLLVAVYLFYKTKDLKSSRKQKILLRDQEEEKQLLLKKKNELLYQQIEDKVNMATLTERNRIAREIHDHVGHMISSCILQVGAITTIVKKEEEKALLRQLKSTLDDAMNQIRRSVHNIFDESVDLKVELEKSIQLLKEFQVDFLYDVSDDMEKEIKFSVIAIAKEAINNIVKYSNGDRVTIQLREHPAFYQLLVRDNGTKRNGNHSGMGLNSMRERVEHLQGVFRVNEEEEFELFITIPRRIQ